MYKQAEAAARAHEEQKLREAAEKDAAFTRKIQEVKTVFFSICIVNFCF